MLCTCCLMYESLLLEIGESLKSCLHGQGLGKEKEEQKGHTGSTGSSSGLAVQEEQGTIGKGPMKDHEDD